MQRRVSIFNMKGGTGKSTLAVNLAHALALQGQHTLLTWLQVLVRQDKQRRTAPKNTKQEPCISI